jgi:predicted permease
MLHVDPGFQPTNVLTARIDLPYTDLNKFTRFYEDLQERMSAQPGVDSVGAAFALPFWSDGIRITFDIEGRPNNPGEEPSEELGIVTPGYFRTMRIPLISGRVFEPTDTDKAPLVAMVNRAFADKYFPGEDPVGKVFEPGISDGRTKGKRRIIGVVGNTKRFDLTAGPSPEYFLPLSQCVAVPPAIVIRSSGDPMSLLGPLREQVKQIDANVPLFEVRTMGDYLSTATATPRFQTVLLTAFAGMALLLASIGLYAILSYMVAQRTTEIGLRMALGAQRSAVMRMVLRKGLALAGIGLALGVALALIVTRFLQSMLFGVKSFDALTFTSVAAVLLSVALIASAAPALRAARLDPMRTLREQ